MFTTLVHAIQTGFNSQDVVPSWPAKLKKRPFESA